MRKSRSKAARRTALAKRVASYTAHFIPEPDGGFSVIVPTLPGCNTQGDTFEAAERNARDAIQLYLTSLLAHGEPIPIEGEMVFKRITVPVRVRAV